jgi:LDH2 family malate/lactate/ureidoglycolate dehydrogenase
MGEFVQMAKSRALRPGFDEILVPGEQEARRTQAKSAGGVPIDDVVLADMRALGRELDLRTPLDDLGPYTGDTL